MKRLEKGFTLIELMIVVAIIGILAAVAAPKFGKQIQKARDSKGVAIIGSWRSASNLYYTDEYVYATTFGALRVYVDDRTVTNTKETSAVDFTGTTSAQAVAVGTGNGNGGIKIDNSPAIKFILATEGAIKIDEENSLKDTVDNQWNEM